MADLSPFDFFRQETSNSDAVVRTEAMNKVALIAAIMGPEKTRHDMLPYLLTKLDDLDQVLLALATKLEKFFPLVGGAEFTQTLLPLIEALCEIEEITVRNAIVNSTCKILKQLSPAHKSPIQSFLDFIKRSSNEEAGELFYARVSCCYLIADLYNVLNDSDKVVTREIFNRLCRDELSIVRRAAALSFVNLSKHIDSDTMGNEFLELLKSLVNDENQHIQSVAIEALPTYCNLLKKANNTTALSNEILPLLKAFSDDMSWKLRLSLSRKFSSYASCFNKTEVADDLFPAIIHLIQDPEPEVRSIAILEVLPFLEVVGNSKFVGDFAPAALQLLDDPVNNVRKLLAELVVDAATKIGSDTLSSQMSDLVIKLMDDADPLVRLRVIRKIPTIAEDTPSLCTRLTEFFKALYSSQNWRVRKELTLNMPHLAKHMGQDYFVDHFMTQFLSLLKDRVDEVRESTAATIPKMVSIGRLNVNWVIEKLYPSVKDMATDTYLVRASLLTALRGFFEIETLSEKFLNEIIGLILNCIKDKVPNVRMRAAQTLNFACSLSHLESVKNSMLSAISELQVDRDKDVKYFAGEKIKN